MILAEHVNNRMNLHVPSNVDVELNQQQTSTMCEKICKKSTNVPENRESINDDCCICLEKLDATQALRQINSCKHIYHDICIRGWIKQRISNPQCPMCKVQLKA